MRLAPASCLLIYAASIVLFAALYTASGLEFRTVSTVLGSESAARKVDVEDEIRFELDGIFAASDTPHPFRVDEVIIDRIDQRIIHFVAFLIRSGTEGVPLGEGAGYAAVIEGRLLFSTLHRDLTDQKKLDLVMLLNDLSSASGDVGVFASLDRFYLQQSEHISITSFQNGKFNLAIDFRRTDALSRLLARWQADLDGRAEHGWASFDRMLYFSAVTATTLGYGDIVPASRAARYAVLSQIAFGFLWIGLFIGAIFRETRAVGRL